jgi:hypothetical protein
VAGPALDAALDLLRPEREHPDAAGVEVLAAAALTGEYDGLWERARGSYAMCVRRDREYLEWKYLRPPHKRYEILEARRAGELQGYAVSRIEDYHGLRLGWIVDVFADADDHAVKDALIGAALLRFRATGVARAQAFAMNAGLGADLARRGFLPARSPMQFCVRARVPSEAVFAERARWHVVFGDSDMDR